MPDKVILQGYIVVPEDQLDAVKSALAEHIELTRREPGNLIFDVKQRDGEPRIFDVYEEFSNRQAFEEHQVRAKSSRWGRVSADVERHYTITGLSNVPEAQLKALPRPINS